MDVTVDAGLAVTNYRLPLDQLPDPLPIAPLTRPFDVTLRPPGSKSLTARAAVLAALADGRSRLTGANRADDTCRLLDALAALGAGVERDGDDVMIDGVGGRFPRGGSVNLGDGGTPTRFMIAAACLADEPVVVDGSPRMRQRPVAEGVTFLRQLGAAIDYVEAADRLPVRIRPADTMRGGRVEIPTTLSSQFISALLLIGPFLPDGVHLKYVGGVTSSTYVDLTIAMLRRAGVTVTHEAPGGFPAHGAYGVDDVRPQPVAAIDLEIEPDASSAAYWLAAAALTTGSTVTIEALPGDSLQPDLGVLRALIAAGAAVDVVDGDGCRLAGGAAIETLSCDCSAFPDGAMTLAATAAMARGTTTLTGLRTLRLKETDRIAALARGLRATGCRVLSTDDSITIDPAKRHGRPVLIDTENDHRMAMAFAVLGLVREGIAIADPRCVAKSYPRFWHDFAGLYE